MATATYQINVDGEPVSTMTADFAQASSPLLMDGESTPYQVADARHRKIEAAEMLLQNAWSNGCAVCEIDSDGDIIGDVTVEEMVE
ncbi:MAG TPA: hypothetical protein PLY87_21730 [Planctomycetaceae bacterium]|nr:hypothetical protein [Planctomycetaceae bacterium]